MIFGSHIQTLHEGFAKFWLRQERIFLRRAVRVVTLGSSAFATFAPVLAAENIRWCMITATGLATFPEVASLTCLTTT